MVEDAAPGIDAGIAAGMTVFALCDDERKGREGVRMIRNLTELTQYLAATRS